MKMKDNEQINTASPIVEIFKTNVSDQQLANKIIMDLNQLFPDYNINFDLEDCDRILRIDCEFLLSERVISILKEKGFSCEELLY